MSGQSNMLLSNAPCGWAFASSRAGASHLRSGLPCQDAYAIWSSAFMGQPCVIAAIADGHGDARHDQSHFGAALAVRAAIEELHSLELAMRAPVGQSHIRQCNGNGGLTRQLVNDFKSDFSRRLGKRWREAVDNDAKSRLPEQCSNPVALYSRYGTTLLAVIAVGNELLLGQIGDGEAILVTPEGRVDCPLACEDEGVGVVTDSLCAPDAHRRWRTAALNCSEGGLILLATDGLVNAFTDRSQLHTFARSMSDRIQEHGMLEIAAALPGWLDHYSEKGSGDDITLAIVRLFPASHDQNQPSSDLSNADCVEPFPGNEHVIGNRTTGICRDGQDSVSGEEKTR